MHEEEKRGSSLILRCQGDRRSHHKWKQSMFWLSKVIRLWFQIHAT